MNPKRQTQYERNDSILKLLGVVALVGIAAYLLWRDVKVAGITEIVQAQTETNKILDQMMEGANKNDLGISTPEDLRNFINNLQSKMTQPDFDPKQRENTKVLIAAQKLVDFIDNLQIESLAQNEGAVYPLLSVIDEKNRTTRNNLETIREKVKKAEDDKIIPPLFEHSFCPQEENEDSLRQQLAEVERKRNQLEICCTRLQGLLGLCPDNEEYWRDYTTKKQQVRCLQGQIRGLEAQLTAYRTSETIKGMEGRVNQRIMIELSSTKQCTP